MSKAKTVTDATFKAEVLEDSKPMIVDFLAEWWGPSRTVAPLLDEIAAEYGDKVDVVKVNVEESGDTAMEYDITSIPAIYLFKDGQVVKRNVGARPKQALIADFEEYIK